MTKLLKNIAHERADYAYKCAEKASSSDYKKDYRAYIKRFPMQVKTNGLAQTMAFFYSKKDGAHDKIYKEIEEWIKNKKGMLSQENKDKEFVNGLTSEDTASYRHITLEVLSILEWWKRFVEALIKVEESEKG